MPSRRFLHDMGTASIVAGVILLALAHVVPRLQRRFGRKFK